MWDGYPEVHHANISAAPVFRVGAHVVTHGLALRPANLRLTDDSSDAAGARGSPRRRRGVAPGGCADADAPSQWWGAAWVVKARESGELGATVWASELQGAFKEEYGAAALDALLKTRKGNSLGGRFMSFTGATRKKPWNPDNSKHERCYSPAETRVERAVVEVTSRMMLSGVADGSKVPFSRGEVAAKAKMRVADVGAAMKRLLRDDAITTHGGNREEGRRARPPRSGGDRRPDKVEQRQRLLAMIERFQVDPEAMSDQQKISSAVMRDLGKRLRKWKADFEQREGRAPTEDDEDDRSRMERKFYWFLPLIQEATFHLKEELDPYARHNVLDQYEARRLLQHFDSIYAEGSRFTEAEGRKEAETMMRLILERYDYEGYRTGPRLARGSLIRLHDSWEQGAERRVVTVLREMLRDGVADGLRKPFRHTDDSPAVSPREGQHTDADDVARRRAAGGVLGAKFGVLAAE
eukprot:gene15560-48633_t